MATSNAPHTPRQRQGRPQPARHVRLATTPDGRTLAVMTIGNDVFNYHLSRLPCPWGEAFRWTKLGRTPEGEPDHYDVVMDERNGHTCECKGYLRHGHCKHIDALRALREHRLI